MQDPGLKTENYIRDVLFIFFAQRNLILGTTAIIFAAAVVIAVVWPRTYGAYGAVLVRGKDMQKSPQALERIDVRTFPIEREDLFAEMEMLRSPEVVENAMEKLKKAGDPAGNVDPLVVRAKLDVQVLPASHMIQVGMEGRNSATMVKQIDAIMEAYIVYRTEVQFPQGAMKFYGDQADTFKRQLDELEQELIALVETSNTPDPANEIATNLLLKRNLEQELIILRNRLIGEEASVDHLSGLLESGEDNNFNFLANPTLNQLSTRLVDLKVERGKIARNYQVTSKNVSRIDEQIVELQRMLNKEVVFYRDEQASIMASTQRKIEQTEAMIAQIVADNVALNRQALRQNELTEESKLLRESYQTFVKRREEARMNSSVNTDYSSFFVSILNRGYSPPAAIFPKPKILIPLGLLAGLITGFALGFLREYFDHTFKNPRDVEHFAGLPMLFSLPVLREPDALDETEEAAEPG